MKTLHEAAAKALAVLDSFALHTPEILSGPDYETATELRSALKLSSKQVPGDGSGLEIFAKSTSDVVDLLTKMDEKIEDFESSKQAQQVALSHPTIKEIVINADYREMWVEQLRINQELCAQLAAPQATYMTELNKEISYSWLRACDEAMTSLHIGVANLSDSYASAKEKLRALINLHITIATDPAVNGGYKLVPIETSSVKQVALSDTGNTKCNPHPDAPHGFNRNASHFEGRYVCDCEGWIQDWETKEFK